MSEPADKIEALTWNFGVAVCKEHENCVVVIENKIGEIQEEDMYHTSSIRDRRELYNLLKKLDRKWKGR